MVRSVRDVSSADFHEDSEKVPPVADGAEGAVRERAFVPSGGDLLRARTAAECLKRVKILLIFGKSPKKSVVFPLKNIDKIFVGKYDFLIIF